MPLIGARFYTMVDDALVRGDEIENQLRYFSFTSVNHNMLYLMFIIVIHLKMVDSSGSYASLESPIVVNTASMKLEIATC